MNWKQLLLFLTILVGSRFTTSEAYIPTDEAIERHRVVAEYAVKVEYNNAYQMLVDTLKWHEGFRATPYYCLAEVLTVGYGHAIQEGETFNYPLSEEDAETLLKSDLDWAIKFVKSTTDLDHLQLLAIAHFVYALGSGSFQRSTLRELIMSDLPIDREIVKWVHIRTREGIIRSDHLVGSRRMELELYNQLKT